MPSTGSPAMLAWLAWLASIAPDARDAALEARLGLTLDAPGAQVPPGEHMLGYHAAGVAPIVRALLEVPVTKRDVLVDLGSGLGKVVLLARMLTGATARGIEVQPALVSRARAVADQLGVEADYTCADARTAALDDGTVFFLYAPFTGPVLEAVAARLREVARARPIVVCALGVDLDRVAPWLRPRPSDAFWLTVYDGGEPRPDGRARCGGLAIADTTAAGAIALGRPWP